MSCYPGPQPIAGCSFGPPIYRSDLLSDAFLGLRVPLISQRNDLKSDCCSLSPEQRAASSKVSPEIPRERRRPRFPAQGCLTEIGSSTHENLVHDFAMLHSVFRILGSVRACVRAQHAAAPHVASVALGLALLYDVLRKLAYI